MQSTHLRSIHTVQERQRWADDRAEAEGIGAASTGVACSREDAVALQAVWLA